MNKSIYLQEIKDLSSEIKEYLRFENNQDHLILGKSLLIMLDSLKIRLEGNVILFERETDLVNFQKKIDYIKDTWSKLRR